ncbi:3 beta-hydroxysteroid dehydrogenase/Delta 5--_4-isomerase type 4-like [Lineus longissimus]|uniref:3 beta-hydroxysteroid dehydrogenase/Delta 5-->4-isomerase type 4-like n=1 Tax=Lineus longissimus TaxID=88925 RepID=UPI002B4D029B
MSEKADGDVVLITGGAGFLGQHCISLIQERVNYVREIRILDTKPYQNLLGHRESLPVISHVGDICDISLLRQSLNGVDSVIHIAGVISVPMFPNIKEMERVNVQGTQNLINACLDKGVKRLVYTSTVDVVVGYENIIDGDESTPIPDEFVYKGYPSSKYQAEVLVNQAHGTPLKEGNGALHTITLRPNVMYGEQDPHYIVKALEGARTRNGVLQRFGSPDSKFQHAYAGNAAWAHISADKALKEDPKAGGQSYFVTDDTPVQNPFTLLEPFLKSHGFKVSDSSIPSWLVLGVFKFIEWIAWFISPVYTLNPSISTASITYISNTYSFSSNKAREKLGYQPIYTPEESLEKSLKYYAPPSPMGSSPFSVDSSKD